MELFNYSPDLNPMGIDEWKLKKVRSAQIVGLEPRLFRSGFGSFRRRLLSEQYLITVPRFPPLRKTLRDLRRSRHSLGVPHSSTQVTVQRKFPAKPKPKSHHTKIKVVKERKKIDRLIFKDLKQYVRKPEGGLKHQRMFGCGSKLISHTN